MTKPYEDMTEDEKRADFQARCEKSNELVRKYIHRVGVIGEVPKFEGERLVEIRPHAWPVYGKPDGVSKIAAVYIFEKIV